ncbi:hypothetical protein HYW44_00990 [Candidatus Daviesbacteria bacterium]|nr:hypothetical protein [Candidatus Daviesbacteria bacterium]
MRVNAEWPSHLRVRVENGAFIGIASSRPENISGEVPFGELGRRLRSSDIHLGHEIIFGGDADPKFYTQLVNNPASRRGATTSEALLLIQGAKRLGIEDTPSEGILGNAEVTLATTLKALLENASGSARVRYTRELAILHGDAEFITNPQEKNRKVS